MKRSCSRRADPAGGQWLPAAAVLLALAAALALALNRAPPEIRLGRRVQLTLDPGLEIDPALSPDGKLVAYAAGRWAQTRLYVRQVDGGTPVAITPERRIRPDAAVVAGWEAGSSSARSAGSR